MLNHESMHVIGWS